MRKFSPKIGPTIATLVMFPLLVHLGFWQLDRAEEKRRSAAAFSTGQLKPPEAINKSMASNIQDVFWYPVAGNGSYHSISILLDNRIRDGRAGYDVLTPLIASDGTAVLVDRGWIPANANRSKSPEFDAFPSATSYQGNLGPPPATGISINEHATEIEQLNDSTIRVQKIDVELLSSELSLPLMKGVVYLSNDSPDGFRRDWPTPGFNPEKHEAYATQWFVMAVIVLGLFFVLNIKKPPTNEQAKHSPIDSEKSKE